MSRLIDFNKISECCSYSKKDSELTVADVENFLEIMLANSHKLLLGAMRMGLELGLKDIGNLNQIRSSIFSLDINPVTYILVH